MFLAELISQSWQALMRNRLRSVLTMLGIVWGLVSVVILLAYGQGLGGSVLHAFLSMGDNVIVLWPGQTSMQSGGQRAGKKIKFEYEDVEAVREEVPIVRADDWPYAIDGVPHVLTTYRASYRYQWLRIEPVRVQALATAYVLRGLLLGHRSFTCTVEAANGCWSVSARRSDYPNEHELQARLQRRHTICSARRRQIRSRIPRLRG